MPSMIQDFIKNLIDDFFRSRAERPAAPGSWKNLKKWKSEFRDFSEDTFWKWRASRSASTVNKLLDDGLAASVEQKIIKALEEEMDLFFRSRWQIYEKNSFLSLKMISVALALWIIGFGILSVMCQSIIWTMSCLCWLCGGSSLGLAGILFCLEPKCHWGSSRRFIEKFFVDAEEKWKNLQDRKIKEL